MNTLLLVMAALLGLLAFFEPCTIATHTLFSVRTHQQSNRRIFHQIMQVWISRSLLISGLLGISVLSIGTIQWNNWLPSILLLIIASVYLISRTIYIPVPHLEFHKLLPGSKNLPQSVQLGLTLPACTLPLLLVIIAMAVTFHSFSFALLAGIVFASLFTLPMIISILLGIDARGATFLRSTTQAAPYVTAVLLAVFAIYLMPWSTDAIFALTTQQFKEQLSHISVTGLLIAFLAGFVFSFNPVSFVSIPVMLAYITRTDEKKQAIKMGIAFIFGLIATHTLLGVSAALGGEWVKSIMGREWALLLGPVLIIMGLVWASWLNLRLPWMGMKARRITGIGGAFLLAIPFSIAICPFCAPALMVALTASASIGSIWFGASLLFLFALGRSIPIIIGALSMEWLESLQFFQQWQTIFEKIAGIVLILAGVFILNEYFLIITY